MIEAIKRDRITQLLLIGVILVLCFIAFFVLWVAWRSVQVPATLPTIIPPLTTPGSPGTPIVISIKGEGDKIENFEITVSGTGKATFVHKGDANFVVNIRKADGAMIEQVVNEIGEYQGEKLITLDRGRYIFEITASGNWLIVMLPPQ